MAVIGGGPAGLMAAEVLAQGTHLLAGMAAAGLAAHAADDAAGDAATTAASDGGAPTA